MPRKREIKPSFYMDEDLAECSVWARLLFPALWQLADREGRLEDRPAMIRIHAFPYDNLEALHVSVNDMLEELARPRKHCPEGGAFIVRYIVKGRRYIQIRNFVKHQRPHPNEIASEIPIQPIETARTTKVDSADGNGEQRSRLQSKPSVPSMPSGSASRSEPAYVPSPAARTEGAIQAKTDSLRGQLLAAASKIGDRTGRDPPGVVKELTAYVNKAGDKIEGRYNPSGMSIERLEKSLEDAQGWIVDLDKADAKKAATG